MVCMSIHCAISLGPILVVARVRALTHIPPVMTRHNDAPRANTRTSSSVGLYTLVVLVILMRVYCVLVYSMLIGVMLHTRQPVVRVVLR